MITTIPATPIPILSPDSLVCSVDSKTCSNITTFSSINTEEPYYVGHLSVEGDFFKEPITIFECENHKKIQEIFFHKDVITVICNDQTMKKIYIHNNE